MAGAGLMAAVMSFNGRKKHLKLQIKHRARKDEAIHNYGTHEYILHTNGNGS
jgi:hypothetical protein